jgi:hypothetical protein
MNRDQILSALKNAELCDDCLSTSSKVYPRQTVNVICRSLSEASLIHRHNGKCNHCNKVKIVNLLRDGVELKFAPQTVTPSTDTKSWYWEGNVQSQVVSFLAKNEYKIISVADTASRVPGKDIIALDPKGIELWVSVKGFPEKSSTVQARHWFSGAVFDLLLYRGENQNVKLAIAFPDGFVTYTNLLPRIDWIKQLMPFEVFWVAENGSVRVE